MQVMSEFRCEAWSGISGTLRANEHEERRKAESQRRRAVVNTWLRHKETGYGLCAPLGTKAGKTQTSDHGVRASLVGPRVRSVMSASLRPHGC